MKNLNFSKGRQGEEIAANYLKKNGYQVIDQNWNTRWGELDLIATASNIIVFVEVKLKVGDKFGMPEDMINKKKLQQVQNTAEMYLLNNPKYKTFKKRIDAICVVLSESGEVQKINHYENP